MVDHLLLGQPSCNGEDVLVVLHSEFTAELACACKAIKFRVGIGKKQLMLFADFDKKFLGNESWLENGQTEALTEQAVSQIP